MDSIIDINLSELFTFLFTKLQVIDNSGINDK